MDGNGRTTAGDALLIINGLNLRNVIDEDSVLSDPSTLNVGEYRFFDVNADGRLTAGDALSVISILNREAITSGESESLPVLLRSESVGDSVPSDANKAPESLTPSRETLQAMNDRFPDLSSLKQKGDVESGGKASGEKSSVVDLDLTLAGTWDWLE